MMPKKQSAKPKGRTKVKDLSKKEEKLSQSKLKKVKGGAVSAPSNSSMSKPVYEWIES
jgi:hypothetical protein